MGKKVFSDEDIKTIIYEYTNNIIGIESLASKYKVGKLKIRAVLNDNGILIKSKGAQVTIGNSSEIEQSKTQLYESFNEDKQLIAVCKKSGKEYDDINNLSGSLTRHILDTYGNVPIPTNTYQRKKYELVHKKKWFEEYFDIKEVNKKETVKCGLCNWETYDLSNNTGSLTKHILEAHNLNEFEYMAKFPESSKFWNNKLFRNNRLNDSNEYVTCLECGEDFIGLSHTHLLSAHNMSFDDYKLKWGDKIDVFSKNTSKKLSQNAIEINKNMINVFTTKPQIEIKEFLESELGLNVVLNERKLVGLELDLYVNSHKIAIEYNGLYWHNETAGKYERYHINKTEVCLKNGISLIHIFEDEWLNKKDIVFKRLRHIFKSSTNKLYARKCKIKEINTKIKDDYLNNNHIQGSDKSSIRLGAFYNGILVGVMTFSNLRKSLGYNKTDENFYELVRFASDNVIGLAGKFLKYFIKKYNPNKIISYADRRWTPNYEGSVYSVLGFNLVNATKPNYWYTKDFRTREHRFNYRKDILVSKGFDINKTEREIMNELGYHRIWDCGSFKFELTL